MSSFYKMQEITMTQNGTFYDYGEVNGYAAGEVIAFPNDKMSTSTACIMVGLGKATVTKVEA